MRMQLQGRVYIPGSASAFPVQFYYYGREELISFSLYGNGFGF
jgi:hypothetical protein